MGAVALAAAGAGCATVNPGLVTARVLGPERVAVDLGSAYAAPVVDTALRDAQAAGARAASGTAAPNDAAALVRGALARAYVPPGVGGYVSARIGLPHDAEAQLALVGRSLRLGARRVFWQDELWAVSLGLQARGSTLAPGAEAAVAGLTVYDARVLGADATALIGRTTSGNLYDVWLGLRVGYTRADGTLALARVDAGAPFGAAADRLDTAATLGVRVGFGRVSALAEIETTVGWFWGRAATGARASGAMLALVPAAALSYAF